LFAEPVGIDDVGIEVLGDPLFELGMALVTGISDGFEELSIAPRGRRHLRVGLVRRLPSGADR
jgi:hypothetical protein